MVTMVIHVIHVDYTTVLFIHLEPTHPDALYGYSGDRELQESETVIVPPGTKKRSIV